MPIKLVFIGASAYPETFHLIRDANLVNPRYHVIGILDDDLGLHGRDVGGVSVLGGLPLAANFPDEVRFVFGIGSHRTRLRRHEILQRVGVADDRFETLVHPSAIVLLDVQMGPGCIIHPGAIIGQESVLEGFNLVFPYSIVASRNHLGRFAMLTSHVSLTNGVRLGRSAFIGTASAVAEGVSIGAGAMIGMGSVVNKDVPPGVTALGNPVRFVDRIDVPNALLTNGVG